MDTNLTGKVAIVTGGSANLGKLFSEALADDGASVAVHFNGPGRQPEADKVVADLEGRGVEAMSHQGDLTANSKITELVDATIKRFGHWDILVNTAGVIIRKPLAETTEEEYDNSFAVNAKIPFFFMAEAFNKMADDGRIVNMVTTQVAVTASDVFRVCGKQGSGRALHEGLCKKRSGGEGSRSTASLRVHRRQVSSTTPKTRRRSPGSPT